jgi:hypothetical protein
VPAGAIVIVDMPVPVPGTVTVVYGPVNVTEPDVVAGGVCTYTVPVESVPAGPIVTVDMPVPVPGTVMVVYGPVKAGPVVDDVPWLETEPGGMEPPALDVPEVVADAPEEEPDAVDADVAEGEPDRGVWT